MFQDELLDILHRKVASLPVASKMMKNSSSLYREKGAFFSLSFLIHKYNNCMGRFFSVASLKRGQKRIGCRKKLLNEIFNLNITTILNLYRVLNSHVVLAQNSILVSIVQWCCLEKAGLVSPQKMMVSTWKPQQLHSSVSFVSPQSSILVTHSPNITHKHPSPPQPPLIPGK